MSDQLNIIVSTVAGDAIEVNLEQTSTIEDLKKHLVHVARVPLPLQQIVLGGTLLYDKEVLAVHCRSYEGAITVMLVAVLSDELTTALRSPIWKERIAALDPFLDAGVGCDVALGAVLEMMVDEAEVVRCEALRVLAEMVLNTDAKTIASITLETRRLYEAVSILAALARDMELPSTHIGSNVQQVTQKFRTGAVHELAASSLDVWYDALKALAVLSDQGNEKAMDAMLARLEHEQDWFQCAAHLSMSEVSLEFDEVSDYIDHEDPRVRCLATRAVAYIANVTDQRSIARDLVKTRLADEDAIVCGAAMRAMAEIAYYPEIWRE